MHTYILFYVKGNVSKNREREREGSYTCCFNPQMVAVAELDQTEARNLKFHAGLPCGWQGPKYCFPRRTTRRLDQPQSIQDSCWCSDMGLGKQWLNLHCHSIHPGTSHFCMHGLFFSSTKQMLTVPVKRIGLLRLTWGCLRR